MKKDNRELFEVRRDVKCVKCQSKGAVKSYGNYYRNGLGATSINSLQEYANKPFMDHIMGFGGTVPYECLNCGNYGLIDFGGLEGYELAFSTMKEYNYFEFEFYGDEHEKHFAYFIETEKGAENEALIEELRERFVGDGSLEEHHLQNIVDIHQITKQDFIDKAEQLR